MPKSLAKMTGAILACALILPSCSEASSLLENYDERYDLGYDDGYAVGYNTTCEIRATLIEGDWGSEGYSDGYEAGYNDGAAACRMHRSE